jgi:hypothetical protein
MNKIIFSGRTAKATVDILLFAGLFMSILSSRHSGSAWWGSFHCIAGMAWYALILVHIGQHWRIVKSLPKRHILKRNIITVLAVVAFLLITVSIILFIGGINHRSIHIHHATAHIFWLVGIIHAITKVKRFALLLKRKI